MRVSVAVWGRFWAFNLAAYLAKHQALQTLFTTYPVFKATQMGVPASAVRSQVHWDVGARLWQRLPEFLQHPLHTYGLQHFDRWVSAQLQPASVFVGWSGVCLESLVRARTLGAKTVVERGSSHIHVQTQLLQEEYERWGYRFTATSSAIIERELAAYEQCDRICVPSSFAKETFLSQGFHPEQMLHLPFGVSLAEFFPETKNDQVFRIIHSGTVSLRKGIPYLLQAFAELKLPNTELWLLGSLTAEAKPFLAKYADLPVIWKGKQPQAQLRRFYSQGSVFCLMSIEEGLAMVQPQAMACGLPVIHTPNTGGSDIVRDGIDGFCVPIRDVEALKEKILYLYENPDILQEMSQNAHQRAQTALSWEQYGERAIAAYQQLLAD
ncbi:MAG TPA: glycosyltransferase family 1 protein [Cyanobacteria bacterium UBA8156]|jgi:glycosyltransferase involved in cell wall biosynthesis|nr:glycosyltransferase family 1 protein [Cyanobacteria bacterium UBA8156]